MSTSNQKKLKQEIRELEKQRNSLFNLSRKTLFALGKELLVLLREQVTTFSETGSSKPYTSVKLVLVVEPSEVDEFHIGMDTLQQVISEMDGIKTSENLLFFPLKVEQDFPFLLNYPTYMKILEVVKKLRNFYEADAIFRNPIIPIS